jgi:hypothetical protein
VDLCHLETPDPPAIEPQVDLDLVTAAHRRTPYERERSRETPNSREHR